MQTYFSYANTAERGITGSNRLMRHNFNLRATTGLFRDRIKLDGNISFMRQVVKDKPVPGGFYMNPLVGLYRFPRGVDMTPYREHFEVYDPDRKLGVHSARQADADNVNLGILQHLVKVKIGQRARIALYNLVELRLYQVADRDKLAFFRCRRRVDVCLAYAETYHGITDFTVFHFYNHLVSDIFIEACASFFID